MYISAEIGERKRRRRPIRRVVFVVIMLAALIEPLVMYAALTHERAQRRAVADGALAGSTLVQENGARR